MATEWYRKITWTKDDENEFFAKLKRAKKNNIPQYLQIQAYTLFDTNKNEFLNVALNLLAKYFEEYPDDESEKSSSFELMGDIYYKMGKYDIALENYNNAIEYEKICPNILTEAYIRYSELVIELDRTDLFDKVEELILSRIEEEDEDEIDFPINKYTINAILSIIYKQKNNVKKANYYKKLAEEAARATDSGFRWHKKLGLVNNRNKLLDKLMDK